MCSPVEPLGQKDNIMVMAETLIIPGNRILVGGQKNKKNWLSMRQRCSFSFFLLLGNELSANWEWMKMKTTNFFVIFPSWWPPNEACLTWPNKKVVTNWGRKQRERERDLSILRGMTSDYLCHCKLSVSQVPNGAFASWLSHHPSLWRWQTWRDTDYYYMHEYD